MRLRNIPTARDELAASPYVIGEEDMAAHRGKWAEAFELKRARAEAADCCDKRPLHIEIGMGKGQFLLELARRNPDINYIGIENYSSVLVHPVRKLEAMSQAGEPLRNILLLRMNAEYLTDIFAPAEADRIYLNFSDPCTHRYSPPARMSNSRPTTAACLTLPWKRPGKKAGSWTNSPTTCTATRP